MIILIALATFLLGYLIASSHTKKKLEIARLIGIKSFVHGYCEDLKGMCDSIMETVKADSIKGKAKTRHAHMLSVLSNVHDELVDIWQNEGEEKLATLLHGKISDREAFGRKLDKKMTHLVEVQDKLDENDPIKSLEAISENLRLIEELRSWVSSYTKNPDIYIQTAAVETVAVLETDETFLKMVEKGLKAGKEVPTKKAQEVLKKHSERTDNYAHAMKLLSKNW